MKLLERVKLLLLAKQVREVCVERCAYCAKPLAPATDTLRTVALGRVHIACYDARKARRAQ